LIGCLLAWKFRDGKKPWRFLAENTGLRLKVGQLTNFPEPTSINDIFKFPAADSGGRRP
jgi:hypothetical protein